MKKLLALLLAVIFLLTSLSGCDGSGLWQKNTTLTIYVYKESGWDLMLSGEHLSKLRRSFYALHPETTIDLISKPPFDENEQTKLLTELMSGKGPDLLFINVGSFPNLYKTMKSGAFCDLTPFMEKDKNFKREDYYAPVLDAGVLDGKQYVLPISFAVSAYLTSTETLEETGIQPENCKNFDGLVGEMRRFSQQFPEDKRHLVEGGILFNFLFTDALNQKTGTVDLLTEEVKESCTLFKESLALDSSRYDVFEEAFIGTCESSDKLFDNKLIFNTVSLGNTRGVFESALKISRAETPLLLPRYDRNSGVNATALDAAAVLNQSKNKQNAYDFLMCVFNEPDMSMFSSPAYAAKKQMIFYVESTKRNVEQWEQESSGEQMHLSEEFVANYLEILDQVNTCSFYTEANSMLFELLAPYFKDEASLDDCLQKAQEQLEIYISE